MFDHTLLQGEKIAKSKKKRMPAMVLSQQADKNHPWVTEDDFNQIWHKIFWEYKIPFFLQMKDQTPQKGRVMTK